MWQQIFSATWKTFQSKFSPIIAKFRRHQTLLESQATVAQFEQLELVREKQENEYRIRREDEEKRQRIAIWSWLSAADADADHKRYAAIRAEYPESGLWLLQNAHIKDWLDPTSSETLLWLRGIPGAGKHLLHLKPFIFHYTHTCKHEREGENL